MREAAEIVSTWCYDHEGFRTTSRWDQGVRTTLRRGFGRCEEAVILFVSALRSVGIPAREAGAPYWQHVNDNHVWVEAWLDGDWVPMEAGNPYIQLTGNVRKAPLLYTAVQGNTTKWPESVLNTGPDYTILNVTPNYLPTWKLSVDAVDEHGEPMTSGKIYVSIFNYGAFRPIASVKCSATGCGSIDLGPSSVLLTAARNNRTDFAFVDWSPAYLESGHTAHLDLSRNRTPSGRHQMAFMTPNAPWLKPSVVWNSSYTAAMKQKRERADSRREQHFRGWKTLGDRFAAREPWNATEWSGLSGILAKSRGNAGEIMRGVSGLPETLYPSAQAYLTGMAEKDLVDVTAEQIGDVALSVRARKQAVQLGEVYDDAVFNEYVLADRIEYEPFNRWRPELTDSVQGMEKGSVMNRASRVNSLVAQLPEKRRGFFGPLMTPTQVLESGYATSWREKGIAAAALLRASGIPARVLEEQGWVEFMSAGKWLPMYVDQPESLGVQNATAESTAWYGTPGGLFLQFVRNGTVLDEKDFQYFRDFSIARFDRGSATFSSLEKSLRGRYDPKEKGYAFLFAPGRYWMSAGVRNDRGEPETLLEPFDITGNKIIHMTVDVSR